MRGLFAGLAATAVAPRVIYADNGRPVTAAQAMTYGRMQHEGRLDPAAASGSHALPEAVRADGPRRPGAYFVDSEGREQYEPTAAEREGVVSERERSQEWLTAP